jgi:hypothetical protein
MAHGPDKRFMTRSQHPSPGRFRIKMRPHKAIAASPAKPENAEYTCKMEKMRFKFLATVRQHDIPITMVAYGK